MNDPLSANFNSASSTTYRFEVSAYGDGTTRRADWGAWSMHLDAATNAAPTVSGCTTTLGSISGESSYEGTWTDECVSSNRPSTRYARYFTLELAIPTERALGPPTSEELPPTTEVLRGWLPILEANVTATIRPLCSTKRDPSRRSASSRYYSTRSSSHLPNSPFWSTSVQLAASPNR